MKETLLAIAGITLIGGLIYFGPDIKDHFGKRYADADREIFEKSKPFIHGSVENLARLKMQYELAENENHKKAIKNMVITQTATLDKSQLPSELQLWIQSL